MKTLSGRIGSLEILGKSLEKDKINESEFSSIIKLVTKRIGEIEDHFDEIEDKIYKDKSRIEKTVNDLLSDDRIMKSAQELIGKDLEGKIQDITSSLSSDIGSISKKQDENTNIIAYLKEKYNVLDSLTKGVPKMLKEQEIFLNKIMESKESLANKSESIASEVRSLSGKLSADKDRLMSLEQNMTIQGKENDSRITKVKGELEDFKESISSVIDSINSKLSEIGALGKSLDEKTITESEFISTVKSVSKRIDDIENLYNKLDKESSLDKTKLQVAINQALSDDKILKSTQDSLGKWIDENIQAMNKKMSEQMEKLTVQIQEKADSLNNKIYSDLDKLNTQSNQNYESIVGMKDKLSLLSALAKQSEEHDARISRLKEKVNVLNSLTKEVPKKFDKQSTELKELIGSSGFLSKRADSMDQQARNITEKIDSDSERITSLEKDTKSQFASNERRLDSIEKVMGDMKGKDQGSALEIGVLKERFDDMEKRFEESLKKSNEEKHQLREDLKKQSERVARIIKELSE